MTSPLARSPQLAIKQRLQLNNGLTIPQLGFGTYRIAENDAAAAVTKAISCGFRHVDCARVYGNQREVGKAFAAACRQGGPIRREDLFVTSKLWNTDHDPDRVEAACRETLEELRLDYLDLYLIHWPVAWQRSAVAADGTEDLFPKNEATGCAVEAPVPLIETWKAMEQLVAKGLVKSIGICNAGEKSMRELAGKDVSVLPATNQIEHHPGFQQSKMKMVNAMNGVLTTAYCPLGMPTRFTPDDFLGVANDILFEAIAENLGYSVPRCILNWMSDQNMAILVKSANAKHIEDNAKVMRYVTPQHIKIVFDNYEVGQASTRVINPRDFRAKKGSFFRGPH